MPHFEQGIGSARPRSAPPASGVLVCDGGHTPLLRVRIMLDLGALVMEAEVKGMSIRKQWKQREALGG